MKGMRAFEREQENWRRLHNEELHNLCDSCRVRQRYENEYKYLVGKSGVDRQLGRIMCGQKDKIKMDMKEVGWEAVDWTNLARDRDQWWAVLNTVMNLRFP
jgi:hypothetical protein